MASHAQRNSSVETLRILAMLMIVTSHCVMFTNLDALALPFGVNKVLIETFLYSGGKVGVVAFFAISAWYLSEAGGVKAGLRRVWILEREMLFWSLLLFAATAALDHSQAGVRLATSSLFPTITALWWYPTAYAVFLLFFPFLVTGLRALGRTAHGALAIVMLVLFTGLDMVMPLSAVGLPGGNYLSFVYIYVLITYYRWYMRPMRDATAWWLLGGGYALIAAGAVGGGILYAMTGRLQMLQVYVGKVEFRLPVLMVGLALFVLFERHEFHSAVVNAIASSTFGVYLISEYPTVRQWLWRDPRLDFAALAAGHPVVLIPALVGAACAVFLACTLLDQVRGLLFRATVDRNRGKWFDKLAGAIGAQFVNRKESV
ncbi:acyltransferase family protein [Bifidobacterium stellenboschense]|uniref:Symporter n=1 Tax=Bifidobacterium stellenboschense TaxID=762211 RepID=A0A087DKU6_9BIFI|nr:acyltransferase [Bifidobacterium stellenboschense]KFI96146.1 symporter [Bifidobacterium stellenboschense]